MKRRRRGFKFDFDMIKNFVRVADKAIEAGEEVRENLKGKSKDEIIEMLKGNLSNLKNPKNLFDLQQAFKGKKPAEIKKFLEQNFKDLNASDMADVAKALSEEKGLSEFLSEKLKAETKDPVVKKETPEAKKTPVKEKNQTVSDKTIADNPWFKAAGAALDFKRKTGKTSDVKNNKTPVKKTSESSENKEGKKKPEGPKKN